MGEKESAGCKVFWRRLIWPGAAFRALIWRGSNAIEGRNPTIPLSHDDWLLPPLLFVFTSALAMAQAPASANYSMPSISFDGGGNASISNTYACDGSVGTLSGIATSGSAQETAKVGFLGQIYQVVGFAISAPVLTLDSNQTDQMEAVGTLDDNSLLPIDPTEAGWSVQGGPSLTISAGGLATAGIVYQDSGAVITADFQGLQAWLALVITNSDFAAWQQEYFGSNKAAAAPGGDADGTGQTNVFKYIAGLNPLDPASRFNVSITPPAGPVASYAITFSPIAAGRNYIVQSCTDLTAGDWEALTSSQQSHSGNTMSVTDPSGGSTRKFYRVQISR